MRAVAGRAEDPAPVDDRDPVRRLIRDVPIDGDLVSRTLRFDASGVTPVLCQNLIVAEINRIEDLAECSQARGLRRYDRPRGPLVGSGHGAS